MGRIFVATQLGLGRAVAIKVLRAELVGVEHSLVRFGREARVLASLANPHVIRVFDVGELGDGTPYLVTELLEGEDLAAVLARGPVAPEQAVRWLVDACNGLAEAHALGIIHRDLKPSNLFVTRQGRVMILDFGLAKLASSASRLAATLDGRSGGGGAAVTSVGMVLGSPHYMAPEQAMGGGAATVATDLWALGATLVHLVTGRPPFDGATIDEVLAAILSARGPTIIGMPPRLAAIARRAMAMAPADRYANVGELAADLHVYLARPEGGQSPAALVASAPPAAASPRRGWLWGGVATTIVASGVAAAVAMASRPSSAPPTASRPPPPPVGEAPVRAAPPPRPAVPPAPAPAVLVDEDFVLGLYVTCFDRLDAGVRASWGAYVAFADPGAGPDLTRARAPTPLDAYALAACRESLEATRALAVLAPSTRAYREAIDQLATTLDAAHELYKLRTTASAPAAAKRMHRELQTAFGAYDAADAAVRGVWLERRRARAPERLASVARVHGATGARFAAEQILIAADVTLEEPLRGSAVLALEEAVAVGGTAQEPALVRFHQAALAVLGAAKVVLTDGAPGRDRLVSTYNALVDAAKDIPWTTVRDQRASARPRVRASERLSPPPLYKPIVPPAVAAGISAADYDEAAIRERFTALGWEVGDVTHETFPGCVHVDVRAARPGQGASARLLACESERYAMSEAARLAKMPNTVVRQASMHVLVFSAWGGGLASTAEANELAAAFLVR